jgi:hypothetical protein
MNTLSVSYVPQLGTGAAEHNNDCGSASTLMLLRTYGLAKTTTVDQLYNSMIPAGDTALSFNTMQSKMASYGLKTEWRVDTTMEITFGFLKNKKPLLALIHYATLVDAGVTEKINFRGAHFLVITGIDLDYVFINDPYRTDNKTNIAVPIDIFEKAWKESILDGNSSSSCVIPIIPIKDLSVVVPPIPPVNDSYALTIKGLNVRGGPSTNYPILRIIWQAQTPVIHCSGPITNGYIRLTDKSGYVFFSYLIKV